MARDGEEVELQARPLWVDSLRMLSRPDADHVELEMVCGKGGYVRAIARDLGEALGCHGHVLHLRRTWSGPFDAGEGYGMERIEALARSEEIDTLLAPVEIALDCMPEVKATDQGVARLRNGNPGMVIAHDIEYGEECWASHDGKPVAVGIYRSGELHPSRVFLL